MMAETAQSQVVSTPVVEPSKLHAYGTLTTADALAASVDPTFESVSQPRPIRDMTICGLGHRLN